MQNDEIQVATARSGLKIISYVIGNQEQLHERLVLMTPDDHFDAWAVLQRLAVLAIREFGENSMEYQRYLIQINAHSVFLSDTTIANMRKKLALKTSIDLMQFAAMLCEDVVID